MNPQELQDGLTRLIAERNRFKPGTKARKQAEMMVNSCMSHLLTDVYASWFDPNETNTGGCPQSRAIFIHAVKRSVTLSATGTANQLLWIIQEMSDSFDALSEDITAEIKRLLNTPRT